VRQAMLARRWLALVLATLLGSFVTFGVVVTRDVQVCYCVCVCALCGARCVYVGSCVQGLCEPGPCKLLPQSKRDAEQTIASLQQRLLEAVASKEQCEGQMEMRDLPDNE
jgi:hypothetical protein